MDFPFLGERLLVVDVTGLTNATNRDIFSSTRESGVDTPTTKRILDRVTSELRQTTTLR